MNDLNLPWRIDPKSLTDILDSKNNVVADTYWRGYDAEELNRKKDEVRADRIVEGMNYLHSLAKDGDVVAKGILE